MFFHSVSLPIVRHLGPPLTWPIQNSSDFRTLRFDVTDFALDINAYLVGVNVAKSPDLTVGNIVWDRYTVTMQVTGGRRSYKETIYFSLSFNNGDYENVNVFVPISANLNSIPSDAVISDGQVITFNSRPVEVRDMPQIPGGAADSDLMLIFRAPNIVATLPISALPSGGGGGELHLTTGENVMGHMALMFNRQGYVIHADPTLTSFAFVGVSKQSALAGNPVAIAESGVLVEPSWGWEPDEPLFVGLNGLLTQSPPVIGVVQQIAVAINATSILVKPYAPIIIA